MLNEMQKQLIGDSTVKAILGSLPDFNDILKRNGNMNNAMKAYAALTASMTVQYIFEILNQADIIQLPSDERELRKLMIRSNQTSE